MIDEVWADKVLFSARARAESFSSFSSSFGLSSNDGGATAWVDSSGDDELIAAFRKGVEVKDRKYHLKSYPQCFIGTEAVDWLVNSHWANTRDEAEAMGNRLVKKYANPWQVSQ